MDQNISRMIILQLKESYIVDFHWNNTDQLLDDKGPDKYTADALRKLPLIDSDIKEGKITGGKLADSYCVDKLDAARSQLHNS